MPSDGHVTEHVTWGDHRPPGPPIYRGLEALGFQTFSFLIHNQSHLPPPESQNTPFVIWCVALLFRAIWTLICHQGHLDSGPIKATKASGA